jgi:hypothetical protein
MYVVTKNGKKLPVDDSSIDYNREYVSFHETVGLYTDNTELKKIWILMLEKSNYYNVSKSSDYELELVKELRYDHKPTKEEILWAMSAYGLTRGDIAWVHESYELDME